jgi:anti-anti-sigma factor
MDLQPVSANPCTTCLRHQDNIVVLELAGEIDAFADDALDAAYAEAAAMRPHSLLLNFARVDYINSTGIALIVAVLAQTRRDHVVLQACCLSEHYEEMFRITRLSDFIAVFADEDSALRDLRTK